MPELPEVEALAAFLTQRAVGRVVATVWPVAINVLKTYDPPPTSLAGLEITSVRRFGKFLDIDVSGLHLVTHLARAGWLQWKEKQPTAPPRPGKGPLALRVILDDGSGFDLTEAGTQKRLAVYVVKDPLEVPGIARLGIDPLDPAIHSRHAGGSAQQAAAGQGRAHRPVGARGGGQRLLRRGALGGQDVARSSRPPTSPPRRSTCSTTPWSPPFATRPTGLGGLAAGKLKAEKKQGLSVHARTGEACPRCGDTIREVAFATKSLQYCPTCQTGGKPLADRRMSRLLK